jgi:hypothetical protein
MFVFNRRLYAGGGIFYFPNQPTEIVRIDEQDQWELLVGKPRLTPAGWKYPLSGLNEGFENGFNDHLWRMQSHEGRLYVGTYDGTGEWNMLPGVPPQVADALGCDLYQTADGWYFSGLTTNGFGDTFSYGVRNFASTPFGLFVGTTNPFYGLQILLGTPQPRLAAPERLEVEIAGQKPVLSWAPVNGAASYRIFRSPLRTVTVYPGLFGNPTLPAPYIEVGSTSGTTFTDAGLPRNTQYLYYVVAADASGGTSNESNLVRVPLLTPVMTFSALAAAFDVLSARRMFATAEAERATGVALLQAQGRVATGDLTGAISILASLRRAVLSGSVVKAPHESDFEIRLEKMRRRLELAASAQISTASL